MTREYEKGLWIDRLEKLRERVDSKMAQSKSAHFSCDEMYEMGRIEEIIRAIDFEQCLVDFKRYAARKTWQKRAEAMA